MTDTATPTLETATEGPPVRPLVELLTLAAPTVAQMASYTVMQFIDTWILARSTGAADVTPATAAANAGLIAFSVISLGMGVMFIVNTLVSQAFGAGRNRDCGKVLWQGIWFSIAFSLVLVPLARFAPLVFAWAGHESRLVRLEVTYTRIVLMAAVLKLSATAIEQFLLGVNRPTAVAVASAVAVAVNAVVAWAIVLGRWGFKPHGVAGSAWAQNIGVGVELLVVIAFAALPVVRRTFGSGDWRFRPGVMRDLVTMGIPSGVQIVAEVLAWSAFSMWVMAPFGTGAMGANVFVFRYMSVSFMPAFGMSVAVTALVGRYIGRGEPETAVARANLGFLVTAGYMLLCGAGLFAFRHQLIGLFTSDPNVIRIGGTLLVFAAVYQLFDATYIIYNGGLRGAGDTLVPAIVLASLCWGIVVFVGRLIAEALPTWGPVGPWIAAMVYGGVLSLFIYVRFIRGKWRHVPLESGQTN
jgi:MATE family multidrug resistance protein